MASAFRFSRTTPPVSGRTATGARERGPPASNSGGKWDRESRRKRRFIPFCYGISLFLSMYQSEGGLEKGEEGGRGLKWDLDTISRGIRSRHCSKGRLDYTFCLK